ncbi:hypothetical protein [Paludibacterium denitrificans]|uniref:hypothetical protein n=1 Tax=Paludibacterium denitrificans TaxID=2675226 RepID=UPI001E3EBE7E|nr:hypothetical protein [Paludibacterium denitrificans]
MIVTEDMLERAYISGETQNPNPRVFQLGLQSALSGQYVGVLFDNIVAKAAAYAHAVVCVNK